MKTTTIPKSLHTVTVLVAIARQRIYEKGMRGVTLMHDDAVAHALGMLGYSDTPDTYELAAKARAQLSKGN